MKEFPLLEKESALKCGIGQLDKCCVYLVCGPNGFECARNGGFHTLLTLRTDMVSKRKPTEEYPNCQLRSET